MRRPELPPEVVMERTGRDPDQYSQPYRNILLSFTCYIHLFTQYRRTVVCELIQRCVILIDDDSLRRTPCDDCEDEVIVYKRQYNANRSLWRR